MGSEENPERHWKLIVEEEWESGTNADKGKGYKVEKSLLTTVILEEEVWAKGESGKELENLESPLEQIQWPLSDDEQSKERNANFC